MLTGEMDVLIGAWKSGDTKIIDSIISGVLREQPGLTWMNEKLIYERNRQMVTKIEGFLNTGRTHFVVVGAGHLVGRRGIIELLKVKGYSVEQM